MAVVVKVGLAKARSQEHPLGLPSIEPSFAALQGALVGTWIGSGVVRT